MSSEIAEPKYELIDTSVSPEDIEVSEITQTIQSNDADADADADANASASVNTGHPSIITTSSQDYPLDPNTLVQLTMVALIEKIIADHDMQKKYEYPIDAKYIDCLKQILEKHFTYFGSLEKSLQSIVKDGRISVADFPEIVKMVMDLYAVVYAVHPKDMVNMCAGVLKIIFFITVKEKLIVVENEHENEVISAFDNFVDSIAELLKMHIQLSGGCPTITCNFKKIFGL